MISAVSIIDTVGWVGWGLNFNLSLPPSDAHSLAPSICVSLSVSICLCVSIQCTHTKMNFNKRLLNSLRILKKLSTQPVWNIEIFVAEVSLQYSMSYREIKELLKTMRLTMMASQEGDQISLTQKGKDWFNETVTKIKEETRPLAKEDWEKWIEADEEDENQF
jgi:predicted transcriptional regulator